MMEIVFPPSPNWYLTSVLCVGSDGCIVYGSCSNYITILLPTNTDPSNRTFKVKIINVAHKLRVTCIALCPSWVTTRHFASGADDGIVKLWNADTLSFAIAHNVHAESKETIMGVTFLSEKDVVSIGSLGVLVLWNTKLNSVKIDSKLLRAFKPICLSACPHRGDAVAVGTKQGVVLVLALEVSENFKILFKVHGHETEVTSICWCPSTRCEPLEKQLAMKRPKVKSLKVRKVSSKKLDTSSKNGQGSELPEDDKSFLNTSEYGLYEQSSGEEADESDIFDVYKENSYKEFGYNPYSDSEKDNDNTKYTPSMLLRKKNQSSDEKFENIPAEPDTSLVTAMEGIQLREGESSKEPAHNEKFLEECQKLQDFVQSKKSIKHPQISVLVEDSFPGADDSIAENVENSDNTLNDTSQINIADESDIFDIYKDPSFYEFGHSKHVPGRSDNEDESEKPKRDADGKKDSKQSEDFLEECKKLQEFMRSKKQGNVAGKSQDVRDGDAAKKESDKESEKIFSRSTDDANTDDDCLDNSLKNESTTNVADESDIFDIYKEPSFYEFGHSKFVPSQSDNEGEIEKPRVKISSDFLKECAKLKEMVAGKSDENSSENEISDLSNNIKKLELDTAKDVSNKAEELLQVNDAEGRTGESNIFLASCCKKGKVCIWRWGGSLVSSGSIMVQDKGKDEKVKKLGHPWGAVYWPTTKLLLTSSKAAQLLRCNFHSCYSRSKTFGFSILHEEHQRGLYSIAASASGSPDDNWRTPANSPIIWTAGQDRLLVGYSFDDNKVVANYTTFGGYVYDLAVSPIDPSRFAIAAGDGMVRVWERGENAGSSGMRHYWNGVQGKVQAVAWHPTREHCLAFSNSEGRVGLIDASSLNPAKVLPPGLPLGAYNICWGPRNVLFANGGGELVVYNTSHINRDPEKLIVSSMGRKWGVSTVVWTEDYLTVGSSEGQLGLLKPDYPYDMVTSAVPHRKSIQCIAWHPIAVSSEDGLSPYGDLVAVSSAAPLLAVMKMVKEDDGSVKLELYEEFAHHHLRVNKLCWSPHHNGKLMSVSHDSAVQITDVLKKCILHTLLGHSEAVLCCSWCPVNPQSVITAGEDHTLRVWNITDHPPQEYSNKKLKQKRKMKLALIEGNIHKSEEIESGDSKPASLQKKADKSEQKLDTTDHVASVDQLARVQKIQKKKLTRTQSCLALLWRQFKESASSPEGCRRLFRHHVAKRDSPQVSEDAKVDYSDGYDYLRIYGSYSEVTELLDLEQQKHEETLNWDAWAMVGLLRGDTKNVLEKAKEKKKLCPSLLSVAPSVSHRFWKEMTAAYAEHLESIGEDGKCSDMLWRILCWRAVLMLCTGSVEQACSFLCSVGMTADAVAVATLRHADHLVHRCLGIWARDNVDQFKYSRAAECYIALNQLLEAAAVLGKSNNEEDLALSADMAKYAALQTPAD